MRAMYLAFCLLLVATLAGCGGSGSGSVESLGLNATNITLDPFSTAPLSARLEFSAPEPGTVTVTILGKPSSSCNVPAGIEISHQFTEVSSDFVLPVLGLYPDYANTLIVDFIGVSGAVTQDKLTIMTAPISPVTAGPVTLPISVEILSNNLPADDSGLYVFSQQKSAFDQCGEVRWIYRGEGWQFYEMLPNGNWLGSININQISYHFGDFSEFTMLGETVRSYPVENYLHHEIQKLPWDNYLVATNSSLIDFAEDGTPEEDMLVEIQAAPGAINSGAIIKSWDFNTILDPGRAPIPSNERPDDWLHLNSAVYDASDNSIIITAQRQSLMAKIDYATGDLIWILGAHEGWGPAFQDKLLTPVDALGNELEISDQYFWPYGPHAALALGDGAVALFDNGAWRGLYEDRAPLAENGEQDFSRGIEYLVNEELMTVQIVWQFDWDKRVFTSITGDIDYLVNGNYLLGFVGTSPGPDNPRVMEVDPATNEILFNAVSNRGELEYRVEKINLYTGY